MITGHPIAIPTHYVETEQLYTRSFAQNIASLAICSANHGEGVSTIAYALARRVAAGGARVLLVDFQTHAQSIQISTSLGFSGEYWQYLPPKTDNPENAILQIVATPQALGNTGAWLLPAPKDPLIMDQLREETRFQAMLRDWKATYDMVIFDLPPVIQKNQNNLPAEYVASKCDGVFFVVQSGHVAEPTIMDAKRRLQNAGARIVGAIMNDADTPSFVSELIRETRRLDRFLPKTMEKLRRYLRQNAFLNQDI